MMKEYKITYKQCESMINGVCSQCGGKLEPLETVDNAGDPTFWSGCKGCCRFDNGVRPETYRVAKELVDKCNYKHYQHIQDNDSDTDEIREYKNKQQISGTCNLVSDVLRIYKRIFPEELQKPSVGGSVFLGIDMSKGDAPRMVDTGHQLIVDINSIAKEHGFDLVDDPLLLTDCESAIDFPLPKLLHVPVTEPEPKTQTEFWANKWNHKRK